MADYEVIFESEFATLRYYPKEKYVHHIVHKPITGKALQDVLNRGTETLAKYGGTKWLSDDRKNAALTEEDALFGLKDWGPRTAAIGWKHWALIVPESAASRASMAAIVETFFNLGVHVVIFTDPEKARAWLVSA